MTALVTPTASPHGPDPDPEHAPTDPTDPAPPPPQPGSAAPAPSPAVRPWRRSRADVLLCCALLAAVLLVQGWNVTHYPLVSECEAALLADAWAVQHGEGLALTTYRWDQPPLAPLQLALLTWLPALLSPEALTVAPVRAVALAASAMSAVLLYVLARRLRLPRWAAGAAVALYGLSPLSVVTLRAVSSDGLALPWLLCAFVLAVPPHPHPQLHTAWRPFAAGLAAAVAVLTEETAFVALPALLLTLWTHTPHTPHSPHETTRGARGRAALTAACGFLLPLLAWVLLAFLRGGLLPPPGTSRPGASLLGALRERLADAGSGSVFTPGSAARRMIGGWLSCDLVLPVAGLLAALLLVEGARWSRTARASAGPALAVLLTAAFAALCPSGTGGHPGASTYAVQALPFLALSLAALAAALTSRVLHGGRAARDDEHSVQDDEHAVRGDEPRTEHLLLSICRWTLVWLLAAAALLGTVPRWYEGDRAVLTAEANAPQRQALSWLRASVARPESDRVLSDGTLWLGLVHSGFRPRTGAVWSHTAAHDPAVAAALPRGWRDLDYVVSTPLLRREAPRLPMTRRALAHSERLASFGEGAARVEVRWVPAGSQGQGTRKTPGISPSARYGPATEPRQPCPQ
ncbi:phospholipid carrier-dependent glycosyltransferase [Streptomyces daliensis]